MHKQGKSYLEEKHCKMASELYTHTPKEEARGLASTFYHANSHKESYLQPRRSKLVPWFQTSNLQTFWVSATEED